MTAPVGSLDEKKKGAEEGESWLSYGLPLGVLGISPPSVGLVLASSVSGLLRSVERRRPDVVLKPNATNQDENHDLVIRSGSRLQTPRISHDSSLTLPPSTPFSLAPDTTHFELLWRSSRVRTA